MQKALRSFVVSSLMLGLGTACASSTPQPTEPSSVAPPPEAPLPEPAPATEPPSPEAGPVEAGRTTSRPALTAEECAAKHGTAVGDIGDGAIHRPDYVCPGGKPPIGSIEPAADGPVAVEGNVCCPE